MQNTISQNSFISTLRWVARFLSVLSLTLIALFLIGEGIDTERVMPREWFGLLLFPFGLVLGMFIAWWNEALGSIISIASLLAFYLIYGYFMSGSIFQGWAFLLLGLPAFLFLICWLGSPKR